MVAKLTGGLGMMSKQRKVTYIQGEASFVNSTTLKVKKSAGGEETLQFDKIIIATGSSPARPGPLAATGGNILDSTGALDLKDVPKTFLVIGGGYIGLELGTRVRHAGIEGGRGGNDSRAASGRRPRPGSAAAEAAGETVRQDHAEHRGDRAEG